MGHKSENLDRMGRQAAALAQGAHKQRRRVLQIGWLVLPMATVWAVGGVVVASVGAAQAVMGTPSAPTQLFWEDFSNAGANGANVTTYTGGVATQAARYTADSYWGDPAHCNGFVLSTSGAEPAADAACPAGPYSILQTIAGAIGQYHSHTSSGAGQHVVAIYTQDNPRRVRASC